MDELASKLLRSAVTCLKDAEHDVEVEARIGMYLDELQTSGKRVVGFSPDIPVRKWERLRWELNRRLGNVKVTKITSKRYAGIFFRIRTYTIGDKVETKGENCEVGSVSENCEVRTKGEWKITHGRVDTINDWVRYGISREVITSPDIKLPPAASKLTPVTSEITRYSYELVDYNCVVDMSEIIDQTEGAAKIYNIEIELNDKRSFTLEGIRRFIEGVNFTVRAFNDSDLYYTLSRYNELCVYINTTLYVPNTGLTTKNTNMTDGNLLSLANYIDLRILSEARHLSKADLRIGGVVGTNTMYDMTHKTDGDRAMLIICPLGMWIVRQPFSYNLINTNIVFLLDDKELTVLDCELIPEESRLAGAPTTKYWLQVLDAMCVGGYPIGKLPSKYQRLVISKAYLDRLQERLHVVNYDSTVQDFDIESINFSEIDYNERDVVTFPGNLVTVSWKKVKTFRTPQQMFTTAKYFLQRESQLSFKTDGLLLTASNHPYRIRIGEGEKIDRKQPAILKYKPPHLVTIDALINIVDNDIRLMVVNNSAKSSQNLVEFTGTLTRPFDVKTMLDRDSIPADAAGRISEFAWRNLVTIDSSDAVGKLVWIKFRDNKSSPNALRVARDNWKLMIDPVTEFMMTGEGIDLMLYDHNMIKRSLLEESTGILLDFGPGQGGDTGKWENYTTVIGVEPNADYLPELARRARLRGFNVFGENDYVPLGVKSLVIIHGTAQSTTKVVATIRRILGATNDAKVDAIAMMDVGTFFWESKEILTAVVATISSVLRPGGKILWKMMDGDAVRERLTPSLRSREFWHSSLTYGPFTLHAETDNNQSLTGKVMINITKEHSMVRNQIEYLTRITDFYQLLGSEFEVTYQKRADQSGISTVFLGKDSLSVSSLYLYGVIRRIGRTRQ